MESARYFKMLNTPFKVNLGSSLDGIEYLSSIKHLDILSVGDVSNLDGLKQMTNIRRLELQSPALDLTPVGSLVQLRELILTTNNTKAVDITPLSSLVNLRKLMIFQHAISGLAALSGMTELADLNLTGTLVGDFSPISNLQMLRALTIDDRSVTALSQLSAVRELTITHTDGNAKPIDLTPLDKLEALNTLLIMPTGTLVLSPLRQLSRLTHLEILGVGFTVFDFNSLVHLQDMAAIGELRNLKTLTISRTDIQDVNFVKDLKGLEEIAINTAPLRDISAVGDLESLQSFQLSRTSVTNLAPLLRLTKLKKVAIYLHKGIIT